MSCSIPSPNHVCEPSSGTTPHTTNYNWGSGTFNNVTGTQINISNAILHSDTGAVSALNITVSEGYQDVVTNASHLCESLRSLMNSRESPLQRLHTEMSNVVNLIAFVAKALDIVDEIPGKIGSLQHFDRVRRFVRQYNHRLQIMHRDFQDYREHIDKFLVSGFWRGLVLYIFTQYRWKAQFAEIRKSLEEDRAVLEQFLHFLVSRCWRKIITGEYGCGLEKLTYQTGLQADPSICHLPMLTILVRDHLGRRLPIPLEFCTSWMDLEIVIKHCCRDVEGSEFVQRNDWEIVRAMDNTVVDRSYPISKILKPELEFDISIILQALASSVSICPGCDCDNTGNTSCNGWISCYKCNKYFRIVHVAPSPPRVPSAIQLQRLEQRSSSITGSGSISFLPSSVQQILQFMLKYLQDLLLWVLQFRAQRKISLQKKRAMEVVIEKEAPNFIRAPNTEETHTYTPGLNRMTSTKFTRVSVRAQRIIPQSVDASRLTLGSNNYLNAQSQSDNLGNDFQGRLKNLDELQKLDVAIATLRQTNELVREDHPHKHSYMSNLGGVLYMRFKFSGDLQDLEEAIALLRRAAELTPVYDFFRPPLLWRLGKVLHSRFERLGDLQDLDDGIAALRQANELLLDHRLWYWFRCRPSWLGDLGYALHARFERLGNLEDLEDLIDGLRRACELTQNDKPIHLTNLGSALYTRFKCLGDLQDLQDTIASFRRADEPTPDDHYDNFKAVLLSGLIKALFSRFEHLGNLQDLWDAVAAARRASDLTPDDHRHKSSWLSILGESLHERFRRFGDLQDLQDAIASLLRACELTPDDDPYMPSCLSKFTDALYARFERFGDLHDLDDIVARLRQAEQLTPDNHPRKPLLLSNLGYALHARFERLCSHQDLGDEITALRQATELAPDDNPNKLSQLTTLAIALHVRYKRLGNPQDLRDKVRALNRACELIPDDDPNIENAVQRFRHAFVQ